MDMVRHGNENTVIADRIYRWARTLFLVRSGRALPPTLVSELQGQFMVPQAALKVWDVDPRYAEFPFAQGVSEDAKTFASSLTQPYCGLNSGLEAAGWLDDPGTALSVALIPLRAGAINNPGPAFGLLVLASPDPQRFQPGMGTDFLERIAELASAALMRLRPR